MTSSLIVLTRSCVVRNFLAILVPITHSQFPAFHMCWRSRVRMFISIFVSLLKTISRLLLLKVAFWDAMPTEYTIKPLYIYIYIYIYIGNFHFESQL